MQDRRNHYFPDSDNHVVTVLLPTGEYGAYAADTDDGRIIGHGHTRLAAIADMVEIMRGDTE
jgi:hypothetical protein